MLPIAVEVTGTVCGAGCSILSNSWSFASSNSWSKSGKSHYWMQFRMFVRNITLLYSTCIRVYLQIIQRHTIF